MKNSISAIICIAVIATTGCSKNSVPATGIADAGLEANILVDFAGVLVNPNYIDIQNNAARLRDASALLASTPNQANLLAAQTAWKDTRASWELCEAYLFGPVEDFNYDATMDNWPVNKTDLDGLINSNNPLTVADIDPLPTTLKGFHAIEYIIFGVGSTRKASEITERQKQYLVSLSQSLYNTTAQLRNSWDPLAANNFTIQVTEAGNGSTRFATRKEAFIAIAGTMAGICNEVGTGKMEDPLAARDSTLDESSFSHNSVADFTNNIKGILNVYTTSYNGKTGHSLSELVASKNVSLDNKLQTQMKAAVASFGNITTTYEKAIYTQQNQIRTTQAALKTLQATIDSELTDFINVNIKD